MNCWAQLFKNFNLEQNNLDLEFPCFATQFQDQAIHLTCLLGLQSKLGLDLPDPHTHFFRLSNLRYQCSKFLCLIMYFMGTKHVNERSCKKTRCKQAGL